MSGSHDESVGHLSVVEVDQASDGHQCSNASADNVSEDGSIIIISQAEKDRLLAGSADDVVPGSKKSKKKRKRSRKSRDRDQEKQLPLGMRPTPTCFTPSSVLTGPMPAPTPPSQVSTSAPSPPSTPLQTVLTDEELAVRKELEEQAQVLAVTHHFPPYTRYQYVSLGSYGTLESSMNFRDDNLSPENYPVIQFGNLHSPLRCISQYIGPTPLPAQLRHFCYWCPEVEYIPDEFNTPALQRLRYYRNLVDTVTCTIIRIQLHGLVLLVPMYLATLIFDKLFD
jgi:hypothetical protein